MIFINNCGRKEWLTKQDDIMYTKGHDKLSHAKYVIKCNNGKEWKIILNISFLVLDNKEKN